MMTMKSANNYLHPERKVNAVRLAALLVLASSVPTQAATPGAPDVGTLLQQLQPLTEMPSTNKPGLRVEADNGASARLPAGAPFLVQQIRITGNTGFDTATLLALVADGQGKQLTLAQLGELAARLTRYYRDNGYPLSRAIIPAQTIAHGLVRMEVIEARYGQIELVNSSLSRDSLLQETLDTLQSGQDIVQLTMDHTLLLLSDIPGLRVHAKLKPGTAVGTSAMQVLTTAGPKVTGNIGADNYGSVFTGKNRVSATLSIIDPLHLKLSDVLDLSALTSGNGLTYARLGYEAVVNASGTRFGGAYSALSYQLGDSVALLDAHGTARVATVFAKHPLIRSREVNVYGQIQYDGLQLNDRIEISQSETKRHLDNWTLGLSGDAGDGFLSGGSTTWSLRWGIGRLGFDNVAARLADGETAQTQGGFSKWSGHLARLQNLRPGTDLYVAYTGQWASSNLDTSQKMSVGGPYAVRAYDVDTVSGDSGQLLSAELRQNLGPWQAVAFVDSAQITINQNPWVAGTNHVSLSGAGFGLNLNTFDRWSFRAYVARPLGDPPPLLGKEKKTRYWLETRKIF
jgi:hemolysin activation/secretion protein